MCAALCYYATSHHHSPRVVSGEITTLLDRWKAGSAEAGEEVVSKTYGEMRRLARSYLRRERPGHTLQATALLNEVYLRLLPSGPRTAGNREAFFRLMASEMRRRLVDHARRRLAEKRGGGVRTDDLESSPEPAAPDTSNDVLPMLDQGVGDRPRSLRRHARRDEQFGDETGQRLRLDADRAGRR